MRRVLRWSIGVLVIAAAVWVAGVRAHDWWCEGAETGCYPRAEAQDVEAELYVDDRGWVTFRFRSFDGWRYVAWRDFTVALADGSVEICAGDDSVIDYRVSESWRDFYVACALKSPPGDYALFYRGTELDRLTVEA